MAHHFSDSFIERVGVTDSGENPPGEECMSDTRRSGRHWASLVGIHRAPPDPGGGDNPGWTHPLAGRDFFERIPPVEMVCLGRKGEQTHSILIEASGERATLRSLHRHGILVLFQGSRSGFSVHGGVASLARDDSHSLCEERLALNAGRQAEIYYLEKILGVCRIWE